MGCPCDNNCCKDPTTFNDHECTGECEDFCFVMAVCCNSCGEKCYCEV